jgi:hypothetical protein
MESKYLTFKQMPPKPKTQVWHVLSKRDQALLGTIKYHAPWRQYCFFPMENFCGEIKLAEVVFSAGCMLDIINFMNDLKKVKE